MQVGLPFAVLVLGLGYFALMYWASVGFRKSCRKVATTPLTPISFSVLIPARNEEDNIEQCLTSVLSNNYPSNLWEVIVIDDGSSDRTSDIAGKFVAARKSLAVPLRLVELQTGQGKMAALRVGLSASQMEWVITTDADCVVGPSWLESMAACATKGTGTVTGPVIFRDSGTILGRVQALEALGLVALGGGTLTQGFPTICNSANLAFERDTLRMVHEAIDNDRRSPGLDEAMIQLVSKVTGKTACFCANVEATVHTSTHRQLREFFKQRIRWASMGGRYPSIGVVAVSVLVFAFYVTTGLSIALGVWRSEFLYAGLAGLVVKVIADTVLLVPATRFYGRTKWLRLLLPGEVLHLPYIVAVSILGAVGIGNWKGD